MASDSSASSSSGSSHESHKPAASQPLSIPSLSEPIVSVAIPSGSRDVPVQGLRIHPASRAMGRGYETFISLLGQKDIDDLVEKYEIDLSLFEVRAPCSGERASSPREGEIAIYQDALLGSLRIPLPSFAKAILEEYRLCPSQLTPNSWRLLNGFVISFKNYGVEAGEAALLDKLREVDLVLKGPATQGMELPSKDIPFSGCCFREERFDGYEARTVLH
ncbi:hypothetical protein J5N97_028288 [Dioscorea zingiberensis]|uniref:Transposase (putative) gypsy type domain-containing protein n=1 Tax=Dioscorea zingiberensis TaxID=325984 RepID=A0A9D5H4Q0_9LILI|nr:hypothetical protein J5N97_028288 [Dioscorea zingiberensis]